MTSANKLYFLGEVAMVAYIVYLTIAYVMYKMRGGSFSTPSGKNFRLLGFIPALLPTAAAAMFLWVFVPTGTMTDEIVLTWMLLIGTVFGFVVLHKLVVKRTW